MIIFSIDVYNNKVVRLIKGNINFIKYYGYLYEYLDFYNSVKLKKIHLVMLDNIFKKNFKKLKFKKNKVQLGGGFDTKKKIDIFFSKNISFVLGSVVFNNKKEFKKILSFYKKKIIISLDCINNYICINGWKTITKYIFEKKILYIYDLNIKKILYTDISKDGTLKGLDCNSFFFLKKKENIIKFLISGGISDINNIYKIKKIFNFNFIVGTSIYNFFVKFKNIL